MGAAASSFCPGFPEVRATSAGSNLCAKAMKPHIPGYGAQQHNRGEALGSEDLGELTFTVFSALLVSENGVF